MSKDLNRIKGALADKKKTNKWLSELLGVAPTTVSKLCTNNGDLQIVPQAGEIFKPLHTITEKGLLPLNIFAIPWGHHKAILDRYDSEPMKALFL